MKRRPACLAVRLGLCAVAVVGCATNPYVIGAYSKDAGAADDGAVVLGSLTFQANLDSTGASQLDPTLALGVGTDASTPATLALRLQGKNATPTAWATDQGVPLTTATGTPPTIGLMTPFTDGTQAVSLGAQGQTEYVADAGDVAVGDLDGDDAVFEVIVRAAPGCAVMDKRGTGAPGWTLSTSSGGALTLDLDDGQTLAQIASTPLVTDAWYDCLFWVSRAAGGRADCDGLVGAPVNLSALGSVSSAVALTVGGPCAGSDSLQLADVSLFRAPLGTLGPATQWATTSWARFAALTGVLPDIALGTSLPDPAVRSTPAYLDIDRDDGTGRHLFLVGANWPRVACRTDTTGSFCGYLSEPSRPRLAPADPSSWTSSEVTVAPNQAEFADGQSHMDALVASTNATMHTLSWSGQTGAAQQVFSFFARSETGHLIAASVTGQGQALFDLTGLSATSPAGGRATVEDWGGGLVRGSYIFTDTTGAALTYSLTLIGADATPSFAGDGQSSFVDVAGLQVELSAPYAGSLLAADAQAADSLVFVASDGNVPVGGSAALQAQVLSPPGPRLVDQTLLNLNLQDQFANQVGVYITGIDGSFEFLGLQAGATLWGFDDPAFAVDGLRHSVHAQWSPASASMWVDQMKAPSTQEVRPNSSVPLSLDQLDVGFSVNSSGYLEGLISGVEIQGP